MSPTKHERGLWVKVTKPALYHIRFRASLVHSQRVTVKGF